MIKLQKKLEEATQAAKDVLEILDSDFLAITEQYQKEAASELTKVSSTIWRIRIQADKMRMKNCQVRIIDKEKS
jgi:hypothetical protein